MTITEYIAELEKLKSAHGDLEVMSGTANSIFGGFQTSRPPDLKEVAGLRKRERNQRYCILSDDIRTGKFFVYVGW